MFLQGPKDPSWTTSPLQQASRLKSRVWLVGVIKGVQLYKHRLMLTYSQVLRIIEKEKVQKKKKQKNSKTKKQKEKLSG